MESKLNFRDPDYNESKDLLSSIKSNKNDTNLLVHLQKMLHKYFTERPNNGVELFEHFSRECKSLKDPIMHRQQIDRSTEVAKAKIHKKLYDNTNGEEEDIQTEDIGDPVFPNFLKIAFFFEQAGVGLSQQENMHIVLALKRLSERHAVQSLRFWGKMFGLEQNYYVAEAEFREGEEVEEEMEEEAEVDDDQMPDQRSDAGEDEEEAEINVPQSSWKPPPTVPKESHSTGTNKYVYFVCNELGQAWTRLPLVTPAQIVAARKIKRYFTGRLDAAVPCNPPFPGTEANYLRAQIARISAGTLVSPAGYFHFDEDEEQTEEGALHDNFVRNPEYEGQQVRELVDHNNWVHHMAHILPQGRCSWWNPQQKHDNDFEDDEEDDTRADGITIESEVGPSILTPLSEDVAIGSLPAWTMRICSNYFPEQAVALVVSNLWPGAYAFAHKKTFENVYIGWGLKYNVEEFQPVSEPPTMWEYMEAPTIKEAEDPSPEEEAALHAAKAIVMEEGEEKDIDDDDD